jgi:hypothetical protein
VGSFTTIYNSWYNYIVSIIVENLVLLADYMNTELEIVNIARRVT